MTLNCPASLGNRPAQPILRPTEGSDGPSPGGRRRISSRLTPSWSTEGSPLSCCAVRLVARDSSAVAGFTTGSRDLPWQPTSLRSSPLRGSRRARQSFTNCVPVPRDGGWRALTTRPVPTSGSVNGRSPRSRRPAALRRHRRMDGQEIGHGQIRGNALQIIPTETMFPFEMTRECHRCQCVA